MQHLVRCLVLGFSFFAFASQAEAQYPGVVRGSFFSDANQRTVPYNIYLPPGYEESEDYYPVVYWLHGALQDQNTGLIITRSLHNAIVAGELPPMILVLGTDGFRATTGYKDWPARNQYGEQSILELIAHVDTNYRTIPDRSARGIEGFSLGGLCTMFFACKHVDLFTSAVTTGGALADAETYDLAELNAKFLRKNTAFKLCIGTADFISIQQNERFSAHLAVLGIKHDYEVLPGVTHLVLSYYPRLGASTMAFHAARFYGQ